MDHTCHHMLELGGAEVLYQLFPIGARQTSATPPLMGNSLVSALLCQI